MPRERPIPPARELKSDAGDGERPIGELINEIATELNYLDVSRLNPHAFLERRDMLVKRLRRVARRAGPPQEQRPPTTTYRPVTGGTSVKPPPAQRATTVVVFRDRPR